MVLPLVLGCAVAADRLRASARALEPSHLDELLEPPALSPEVVRFLSLGFRSAAADASYLDAIQLFGDKRMIRDTFPNRVRRSEAIARLLEATTDLDPRFTYAYVFGAVAIPVERPDGSCANVDPTLHLLRKGVGAVDDWRVPFNLGYLLSTQKGDFTGAALAMAEAARRPGRPDYLPFLATRLAANGGALETGIALAKAMLQNAQTDDRRKALEERIRLLYMERDLRVIEAAADRYRAKTGKYPPSVEALVQAGELASVPPEPHGGRYVFDPTTGVARSTMAERLVLYGLPQRDVGVTALTSPAPSPAPAPEKQQP